jgi:hypothetical protein
LEAASGVEPLMEVLQTSRPEGPCYVSLCEPFRPLRAKDDSASLQDVLPRGSAHMRRFRITYQEVRM